MEVINFPDAQPGHLIVAITCRETEQWQPFQRLRAFVFRVLEELWRRYLEGIPAFT
jgi:hypothetical protein